jgi:aminodeoxyfutalosine synthase
MTTSTFDAYEERISAGGRLTADEIRELARSSDILRLGMLADAWRRRLHGSKATFLRVAECRVDESIANAVPPAAREIRITGVADTLDVAVTAVRTAKDVAGARTVAGFSWGDVERLSQGSAAGRVLQALRTAGLDALADVAIDEVPDIRGTVRQLRDAGFDGIRLAVARVSAARRTDLLLQAGEAQSEIGGIQAIDPLPSVLQPFRPTTGYEDVKMVALARLAAPDVPTIQVDWRRYGPKLAQVALTFGADDITGVSAAGESPEGRRRAPLEEIRRNIEAAGFEPTERDGRFESA